MKNSIIKIFSYGMSQKFGKKSKKYKNLKIQLILGKIRILHIENIQISWVWNLSIFVGYY
jgi:hypothetical protein